MTTKTKTAGGNGSFQKSDEPDDCLSSLYHTDPRIATAAGRLLAQYERKMEQAQNDDVWVYYFNKWLCVWPLVFADLMGATIPFSGEPQYHGHPAADDYALEAGL